MKRISLILVFLTMALSACGAASYATPGPAYDMDDGYYAGAPAPMAAGRGSAEKSNFLSVSIEDSPTANSEMGEPGQAPSQERMVIENAEISLVVKNPHTRATEIGELAKKLGGYVVSTNLYETYIGNGAKAPQGDMVIRIPAEKLDEALTAIKEGAVEVSSENRSGQDITQEYTDLESRLRNLEATEKQLTRIMEQAEKTEDVMSVFNQLSQVREQIELIKGQMKYYEQSVALSSVTIRLLAEETIQPLEIGPWKPEGAARDAVQALINFLQGFATFVIWLIILYIPAGFLILLLIFALIFTVWKVGSWLWHKLFGKRPGKPAATPLTIKQEENKK